jgi:hypothetical protein
MFVVYTYYVMGSTTLNVSVIFLGGTHNDELEIVRGPLLLAGLNFESNVRHSMWALMSP